MKTLIIPIIILFLLPIFAAAEQGNATRNATIVLFYSQDCPHCHEELAFLDTLAQRYPFTLEKYEVKYNQTNLEYFRQFAAAHNARADAVPFTFVDGEVIIGFTDAIGRRIELLVQGRAREDMQETLFVPFLGMVNLSEFSLPALTVFLGLMDGFNPCAMWALLFLLALLITAQDKRKIWYVGGTFVLVSGAVYYLFLAAWLNAFLFIGVLRITQVIIGLLAVGAGAWYIREFWKNRNNTCEIAPSRTKQRLIERMHALLKPEIALPATIIGVIAMAFFVNMIELLCSLGLPAIYTRILTLHSLPAVSYYLYLLLYVVFYMLDDLIIFFVAAFTLSHVALSHRYARWLHLIGGLLILGLGIWMLLG